MIGSKDDPENIRYPDDTEFIGDLIDPESNMSPFLPCLEFGLEEGSRMQVIGRSGVFYIVTIDSWDKPVFLIPKSQTNRFGINFDEFEWKKIKE